MFTVNVVSPPTAAAALKKKYFFLLLLLLFLFEFFKGQRKIDTKDVLSSTCSTAWLRIACFVDPFYAMNSLGRKRKKAGPLRNTVSLVFDTVP